MKIIEFAIKGTEEYSKTQDKEMEEFGKIENLLTDTISNIGSGNTPTNPSEPEEPKPPVTNADIGKYVNYMPVGVNYTAEAKYSGTAQMESSATGYNVSQVFSQDTSLKWQVWKVENDTLYLISDKVPKKGGYNSLGELILAGSQGYNNGVTLIDNICQANYGINGNTSIKVQNLKLEDILSVKSDDVQNRNVDSYGTQQYTYPESGTFAFPSIWYSKERESLSMAEGNRSVAYPLVELSNTTTSASNQKPYFTQWEFGSIKDENVWKNTEYMNMIVNPTQENEYWLSSRFVAPNGSNGCTFGIQHVSRRTDNI